METNNYSRPLITIPNFNEDEFLMKLPEHQEDPQDPYNSRRVAQETFVFLIRVRKIFKNIYDQLPSFEDRVSGLDLHSLMSDLINNRKTLSQVKTALQSISDVKLYNQILELFKICYVIGKDEIRVNNLNEKLKSKLGIKVPVKDLQSWTVEQVSSYSQQRAIYWDEIIDCIRLTGLTEMCFGGNMFYKIIDYIDLMQIYQLMELPKNKDIKKFWIKHEERLLKDLIAVPNATELTKMRGEIKYRHISSMFLQRIHLLLYYVENVPNVDSLIKGKLFAEFLRINSINGNILENLSLEIISQRDRGSQYVEAIGEGFGFQIALTNGSELPHIQNCISKIGPTISCPSLLSFKRYLSTAYSKINSRDINGVLAIFLINLFRNMGLGGENITRENLNEILDQVLDLLVVAHVYISDSLARNDISYDWIMNFRNILVKCLYEIAPNLIPDFNNLMNEKVLVERDLKDYFINPEREILTLECTKLLKDIKDIPPNEYTRLLNISANGFIILSTKISNIPDLDWGDLIKDGDPWFSLWSLVKRLIANNLDPSLETNPDYLKLKKDLDKYDYIDFVQSGLEGDYYKSVIIEIEMWRTIFEGRPEQEIAKQTIWEIVVNNPERIREILGLSLPWSEQNVNHPLYQYSYEKLALYFDEFYWRDAPSQYKETLLDILTDFKNPFTAFSAQVFLEKIMLSLNDEDRKNLMIELLDRIDKPDLDKLAYLSFLAGIQGVTYRLTKNKGTPVLNISGLFSDCILGNPELFNKFIRNRSHRKTWQIPDYLRQIDKKGLKTKKILSVVSGFNNDLSDFNSDQYPDYFGDQPTRNVFLPEEYYQALGVDNRDRIKGLESELSQKTTLLFSEGSRRIEKLRGYNNPLCRIADYPTILEKATLEADPDGVAVKHIDFWGRVQRLRSHDDEVIDPEFNCGAWQNVFLRFLVNTDGQAGFHVVNRNKLIKSPHINLSNAKEYGVSPNFIYYLIELALEIEHKIKVREEERKPVGEILEPVKLDKILGGEVSQKTTEDVIQQPEIREGIERRNIPPELHIRNISPITVGQTQADGSDIKISKQEEDISRRERVSNTVLQSFLGTEYIDDQWLKDNPIYLYIEETNRLESGGICSRKRLITDPQEIISHHARNIRTYLETGKYLSDIFVRIGVAHAREVKLIRHYSEEDKNMVIFSQKQPTDSSFEKWKNFRKERDLTDENILPVGRGRDVDIVSHLNITSANSIINPVQLLLLLRSDFEKNIFILNKLVMVKSILLQFNSLTKGLDNPDLLKTAKRYLKEQHNIICSVLGKEILENYDIEIIPKQNLSRICSSAEVLMELARRGLDEVKKIYYNSLINNLRIIERQLLAKEEDNELIKTVINRSCRHLKIMGDYDNSELERQLLLKKHELEFISQSLTNVPSLEERGEEAKKTLTNMRQKLDMNNPLDNELFVRQKHKVEVLEKILPTGLSNLEIFSKTIQTGIAVEDILVIEDQNEFIFEKGESIDSDNLGKLSDYRDQLADQIEYLIGSYSPEQPFECEFEAIQDYLAQVQAYTGRSMNYKFSMNKKRIDANLVFPKGGRSYATFVEGRFVPLSEFKD